MNIYEDYIQSGLRNFVGDLGLAKSGLKFISKKSNKGILQVNNKSLNEVRTGLALINEINDVPVSIRTLKVSGVINKVKGEL